MENQEAPEDAAPPPRTFKEKREAYFARREGTFLWLLAPPVLIAAIIFIGLILLWVGNQVGILAGFLTPAHVAN